MFLNMVCINCFNKIFKYLKCLSCYRLKKINIYSISYIVYILFIYFFLDTSFLEGGINFFNCHLLLSYYYFYIFDCDI